MACYEDGSSTAAGFMLLERRRDSYDLHSQPNLQLVAQRQTIDYQHTACCGVRDCPMVRVYAGQLV